MLMAEEVLLLLVNDRTGRFLVDSTRLDNVLAGAVLVELVTTERVGFPPAGGGVKRGRMVVVDPTPLGDPVLDGALATSTSCSRAQSSRLWLESPAGQVVRHGMPSTLRVERRSAPAAVSRSSRVARSRLRTLAINCSCLAGRRAATVASAPSSTGSPGGAGSTTTIRPRLTPPPLGGKLTRSIVTSSTSTAPASTLSSLVESTRNLPVRSSTRSSRTSSAISIQPTLPRRHRAR